MASKDICVQATVDGIPAEATYCFVPETNSTVISLQASTQSQICVSVSGRVLLHDNSDMLDRCAEIINAAELAYHTKEHLWRVLTEEYPNLHKRLLRLHFDCTDRENRGVLEALKELLTLTQEELSLLQDQKS